MTLFLSGITALTALFGLLIGTVRLFPAPPPDLTAFYTLLDKTCERTCLLGIEPEATTIVEAMNRLNDHPWVGSVLRGSANFFEHDVTVYWSWSGAQPDFIDGQVYGKLFGWTDSGSRPHIVIGLEFTTSLRLYDLQQAFGTTPDGATIFKPQANTIDYTLSYHDTVTQSRLNLRTEVPCPFSLMHFWRRPTVVHYSAGRMLSDAVPLANLRGYCQEPE